MASTVGKTDRSSLERANQDLSDLQDRLDILWQNYLDHLDQYQKAQNDLQKQLSAGFFSLTQANYKSPNRRRYGSDFYDGRMKATKRCNVSESSSGSCTVEWGMPPISEPKEHGGEKTSSSSARVVPSQQPSPPATPSRDDSDNEERDPAEPAGRNKDGLPVDEQRLKDKPSTDEPSKPRDPLQWFGILAPRELRSTQASFSTALERTVMEAVNASRIMRETEADIRKIRKAIRKAERVPQG